MIAIDASAIVAILTPESDGEYLARLIETAPLGPGLRIVSTISVWEAASGLARTINITRERALHLVERFMAHATVSAVAPDMAITRIAIEAAARYGRGSGGEEPSVLNMGDCFSYTTAKYFSAKLIFKGDDFSRTDIAIA